jgi:hypothetical protein
MEELLERISEYLLQSGFRYGFYDISNPDDLEALKQAILRQLAELGRVTEDLVEQWSQHPN